MIREKRVLTIAAALAGAHVLAQAPAFIVASLQSPPVILSADDIGDNYDEPLPADLRAPRRSLGLFVNEAKPGEQRAQSRVAPVRMRFVPREQAGPRIFRIETTPRGARMLISGVPAVSAGPAITALESVDLERDDREQRVEMGGRRSIIRLVSADPSYCDAVVSLTSGTSTQKLFDVRNPTPPGGDPNLTFSCDEPHFRIHWAGDLDRDRRLDMLVTFSQKYSYHPRQLLLSSAARAPDLVAEVARYEKFSQ